SDVCSSDLDHRHIDDYPVAFFDTAITQGAGKAGHFVTQFVVGECLAGIGNGGIVNQGGLIAAAGADVGVERYVTGIEYTIGKPFAVAVILGLPDGPGWLDPVDVLRLVAPEVVPLINRPTEFGVVAHVLHLSCIVFYFRVDGYNCRGFEKGGYYTIGVVLIGSGPIL